MMKIYKGLDKIRCKSHWLAVNCAQTEGTQDLVIDYCTPSLSRNGETNYPCQISGHSGERHVITRKMQTRGDEIKDIECECLSAKGKFAIAELLEALGRGRRISDTLMSWSSIRFVSFDTFSETSYFLRRSCSRPLRTLQHILFCALRTRIPRKKI